MRAPAAGGIRNRTGPRGDRRHISPGRVGRRTGRAGRASAAASGAPGDNARVTEPDQLRLLAVHAHPDDESSKGAATMAKYVAEGARVLVATCTGGERGSVLNPAMDRPEVWERLPQIRVEEMARAREILGVEQEFLGFVDSGLPEGDPLPPLPEGCFALVPLEEAAAPLVALIRRFKPQVITTYDERGGYPHPDHIKTHEISVHAFEAAGDPDRYPELGEPWQPSKLYYHMSFTLPRTKALHEAILADRRGVARTPSGWPTGTRRTTSPTGSPRGCPAREYFPVRDAALIAHATQIDPEGRWFACPIDTQQQIWPTEDYELARSLVDVARARGRSVRRHPQRGGGPMSADAARRRRRPAARGRRQVRPARPAADRAAADRGGAAGPLDEHAPQAGPAQLRPRRPRSTEIPDTPAELFEPRREPGRGPARHAAPRAAGHRAAAPTTTTGRTTPRRGADRPAAARAGLPAVRDVDHDADAVGRAGIPVRVKHPERQPRPDAEAELVYALERPGRRHLAEGAEAGDVGELARGWPAWSALGVVDARRRSAGTRRRAADDRRRRGRP